MSTWRLIGSLMAFRLRLFGTVVFFWILVALFPLLPGIAMRDYFNLFDPDAGARWSIGTITVIFLGGVLGRALAVQGAVWGAVTFNQTSATLLRRNLLESLLRSPQARQPPPSIGVVLATLRDDVLEVEEHLEWFADVVGMALFAVIALTIMVKIDGTMTVALILPLGALIGLAKLTGARLWRYQQAERVATGKVLDAIIEVFAAAEPLKCAGTERGAVAHVQQLNEARRGASLRERVFGEILDAIVRSTGTLGTGILLLAALTSIRAGDITVGDFAIFFYYMPWVMELIYMFGIALARHRKVAQSFSRMHTLLDGRPAAELVRPRDDLFERAPAAAAAAAPRPGAPEPLATEPLAAVAVEALTYRHPGSQRGVEDVSFAIAPGTLTVIAGEIGSGKTTLLRCMLGLLRPERGQVCWNGRPVAEAEPFFQPPRIGYVPQQPRVLSSTLRVNLALDAPLGTDELEAALARAVFDADLAQIPERLDVQLGRHGMRLSAGQLQRVAAARALAHRPALLVMDDVTTGLDRRVEEQLWQRVLAVPGTTVLAVSNRRTVLERAAQVVLLKDGRLEAAGPLAELLRESAEMRRLWDAEGSPP